MQVIKHLLFLLSGSLGNTSPTRLPHKRIFFDINTKLMFGVSDKFKSLVQNPRQDIDFAAFQKAF
jgi:hypothetical protein